MKGDSTLIAAEAGSGKTLCFLLPILNKILNEKSYGKKENPADLFENSELQFEKRKMSLSKQIKVKPPRGAIILGSSKELLNQIYSLARRLDIDSKIRMNRVGHSIQTYSPIVEHLTPESTKKDKRLYSTDNDGVSVKNYLNAAQWDQNDIIFTTPVILDFLVT